MSVSIEMSEFQSEDPIRSLKTVEVEKKKEKERQARNDDIALVVCMVILMSLTGGIVMFKVTVIDKKSSLNITTFTPLQQEVHSNMKYIGMGYMPCNGYVPCQPAHLDSEKQQERIEGAMPCHNYNNLGSGAGGCW